MDEQGEPGRGGGQRREPSGSHGAVGDENACEGADDGRMLYPLLIRSVRDVLCVATENEKEALLLENQLIKREKPRFNIRLTDDKTFLSIELTTDEPWPLPGRPAGPTRRACTRSRDDGHDRAG